MVQFLKQLYSFEIFRIFPIDWYLLDVCSTNIKEVLTDWNLLFWLGWKSRYETVSFLENLGFRSSDRPV